MNNSVIPFIYEDHPVRVVMDEKLIRTLHVSGQKREVRTIPEPGLYPLVLGSDKKEECHE